jgi:hypothetical protein
MHYGPGVDLASNRKEYQELPWGIGRQVREADNLTAIYEPTVYKMWEPRSLTPVWAFTACYRVSFIFFTFYTILTRSRDISVGIATSYGLDEQVGREFESR